MPLTREIPEAAMPVLEVLRNDVPRPKTLPSAKYESMRWTEDDRWGSACELCPMGMHPNAISPIPHNCSDFPDATSEAIEAFYNWFDEQKDAQAAVDAIWPQC
jgi:hypothetical protein